MSLKLSGFKSFADSTTLVFPDNRTAVVGPNGCGKSNVIDAIRWVMGESSARQLRGGAMSDVIFAGTAQRKPIGQASVELRFENTYGKLGGEYNAYTELSVRRQVNRDGRSDYFLNSTRCRRRDITDIFLGTGLGPRSYAIIEQGMINRLVDAKPDEMRVFIEEAAGVSRYQARRRETLQHLEHTRQNLSRLQDIASELEAQMRSLKRQSQAAVKYQELEQQRLQLNVQIWSAHHARAEQAQQQYTAQLSQLGEQYRQLRSERNQVERDWQNSSQLVSELLIKAEPMQQIWQQAARELSQLEATLQQLEQQQQYQQQQHDEAAARLQTLAVQTAEDQQQLQQLITALATSRQQLDSALPHSQSARQQLQQQEQAYQHSEQAWQNGQQQRQQLVQQQQQRQQQIDAVARAGLRVEQQLQQLGAQLEKLHSAQQQDELADLVLEQEDLTLDRTRLEQNITRLTEQLKQQAEQLQQQKDQVQTLQSRQLQYQTELQAIEKLQGKTAQSKQQTQQQTKQQPAKQPPKPSPTVHLLQQLQLSPEAKPHLALIEKFLADWLGAVQLEAADSASANIARSYVNHRETNLNSSSQALVHPEVTCLHQWIQPVLDCWQAVGIVPDHALALSLQNQLEPGQSLLSLDGYWLGSNWQVNLNIDEQAARQQGMLQQQLRQQELQQLLAQNQQLFMPLQQQYQQQQQDYQAGQEQLKPLQQALVQLNQQQAQLELQRARLESTIQASQQQEIQLQQQLVHLQHTQQDDQEQLSDWQMELAGLGLRLDQLSPQLEVLQAQLHRARQQLQEARTNDQLAQQQLQQLEQQQQQLQLQKQAVQQSLDRAQPQQLQLEQQLQQLEQSFEQQAQNKPQLFSALQQKQHQATLAQQELAGWQQQLEVRQQEQQRLGQLRQEGQFQEDQLRDELEKIRLHWQECKHKLEHVLEQLDELQATPLPVDDSLLHDWQQQLDKVQQQMQKLGHLNLAAPKDLEEVSQRHAELELQMQDLQQAITQLEQAMQHIDQETRTLFMQTFDQVNAELKVLFPKVFGGGEASLSLEDNWQSGVKLMARPPGKRNSSLALLSGGEKALTALALVFAIFRLNPAPFCVLDEVDAPLDDANVRRFCHLVKELSQQVQFIYITHNKLAMTMATDLLGVTMPEPGASRLVAVNIEQAATFSATPE